MSSWIEPQYESHPNQPYLRSLDVPDGRIRGADHPHPPTMLNYPYTPSPISSRQTYNSGLYGPRPQPTPPEPIQGFATPAMVPRAMTELEEADDDEYMEVEPAADLETPIYRSEYDDEPPPQKKLRFVGGFIRGLKKIPRAVRRGFSPDKREVLTPPGLAYQAPYHAQYIDEEEPQEPEAAPPYDAPSDHVEGDWGYTEGVDMPGEFQSSHSPSRTPSHTIRGPRSESQLTYQSLTDPLARHVSQHGSLHPSQRSSFPRTVRNPDPPSPTEGSGTINANSPRLEQPPYEPEPDSAPRTPHLSPLAPARRPTVTVQSPTGSPVYFDPERTEDYEGMDMDSPVEHSPEPPEPSQFARIAKFFRDLNNLPWVSPKVTVDFNPTDAERARYTHAQGSGKSWYTGHLQDLDLLGGGSSTRRLTAPSGSLGPAPGSSATFAPLHGPGSASSSEGSQHVPTGPTFPSYPYPVQTLALPPHPLYYYPYPGMPPPPQQQQQQQSPLARAPEQVSPQLSGNSDVPRQPFLYVVAMPPGYAPGSVDPSRPMQPAFGVPHPPPV